MARSIILLYLFLTINLVSAQNNYTISGKIENAGDISIAYLYYTQQNNNIVDSCYVKDGHFDFSGSVEYPVMAILELKSKNPSLDNNNVIRFYLEGSSISISIDLIKNAIAVKGSHTHDLHLEFISLLKPMQEEMNNLNIAYNNASAEQRTSSSFKEELKRREQNVHDMNSKLIYQFINNHPNDFISLYLLLVQLDNVPDDMQIEPTYSLLSETIKKSFVGKEFNDKLQKLKSFAMGATAPEFACKDINGNLVKLSDFRGKYLLLNFWASDCNHCLQELPNLIKVYNTVKGEDFDILSVALDSSGREKQWRELVKEYKLPWVNLFDERVNGKKKLSGLYNVHQTPFNLLLNKEGKIIAKNLYGEDLLYRLKTILQFSRQRK